MEGEGTTRGGRAWLVIVVAALVLVYLVTIDEVAGLYLDDGWYLVLAKSLASGQGFTLMNAPVAGVLPFYPPGFPALLALVFLVAPSFPGNVWLMKAVSVGVLVASVFLTRQYFFRVRREPLLIASCLALLLLVHAHMHFLLTSAVMAEALFTALQMAAVVAVERSVRQAEHPVRSSLVAAAAIAGTILVRSIGIVLLPAAVLYVLLRCGLGRAALLAALAVALLAPWQIHAVLHAPTAEQRAIVNDPIAWPYTDQFMMRYVGRAESGRVALSDLPGRIPGNVRQIAGRSIGDLYANPLLEVVARAGAAGAWLAALLSVVLTVVTVLGFLMVVRVGPGVAEIYVAGTVALLLVVAFPADRYLLPLLPFLAWYLVVGAGTIVDVIARARGAASSVTVSGGRALGTSLVLGLLLVNVAGLVRDSSDTLGLTPGRRTAWRSAFAENLSLLKWVNAHLPRDVVLATHNPGMVFLFTGNPTVGSWEAATNAARWRAAKARFWVDNTVASYRFPDFAQSGVAALVRTEHLRLGIYQIPQAGFVPR